MSRVWFAQPLETVATWWRVLRRDGVTLGFTTHDRELWFEGVRHSAAPGMVPSAIRRTADFTPDSAEVEGALSHASISAEDLAQGRYDAAGVQVGVVDWETLETAVLYSGTIGDIAQQDGAFSAALVSRKAALQHDPVPRTSPTCRAEFCGPGCNLSAAQFTRVDRIIAADSARGAVRLEGPGNQIGALLRVIDGPLAGLRASVLGMDADWCWLDRPIDLPPLPGNRVLVRQGCDKRLQTCATQFANALNFCGEPFLPGNDQLTRYPSASG